MDFLVGPSSTYLKMWFPYQRWGNVIFRLMDRKNPWNMSMKRASQMGRGCKWDVSHSSYVTGSDSSFLVPFSVYRISTFQPGTSLSKMTGLNRNGWISDHRHISQKMKTKEISHSQKMRQVACWQLTGRRLRYSTLFLSQFLLAIALPTYLEILTLKAGGMKSSRLGLSTLCCPHSFFFLYASFSAEQGVVLLVSDQLSWLCPFPMPVLPSVSWLG